MPTDLDITFNSPNGFQGYVITQFNSSPPTYNYGRAIALQNDGKSLMVGDTDNGVTSVIAMQRCNTDGTFDNTFGPGFNGLVTAQIGSDPTVTNALAIQQDGSIVVCGSIPQGGQPTMFVARFTSTGFLDTNFATPNGYILIPASNFSPYTFDKSWGASVQIDTTTTPNTIVIGGYVRRTLVPTYNNRYYFALARLDLNGNLDTFFGTNGLVAKNFDITKDEYGNSLAISSTGDYILGGSEQNNLGTNNFVIAKFDTNGSPIISFGVQGLVVVPKFFPSGSDDYGTSLKIQQDGKYVLGGTSTKVPSGDSCYVLARVDPTAGTLDASFGIGGKVITDLTLQTPSVNLFGNSLAIQTDGKIVLGGYYDILSTSVNSFSLARYNTDGSLDTTFGSLGNGLILEDILPVPIKEYGQSIAIQSDGKILVGGAEGEFGDVTETKFLLARYLGFPPFPPPIVPICFPAGTPVLTDQGNLPIEQINPEIHTIHRRPIIAITQSFMNEDNIVCIEKHSLGINIPNKRTYISNYHGIVYHNKLIPAKQLVGRIHGIYHVKYNGEMLYNVLMERHYIINVNNMRVETLNPKNIVAKLYTNKHTPEEKTKLILEINEMSKNNINKHNYITYNGYEKITNNTTRRKFTILRCNPLISRLNFHTKRHFIQNNSYNNTIKNRSSFTTHNHMVKINKHTFRHGRRRR
jgi:uncharacterized delta-60 repeat protein